MRASESSTENSREVAYLVRLWSSGPAGPWRASARHLGSGQLHQFANPESLYVFLHHSCHNRPAPGGEAPSASPEGSPP